MSLARLTAQAEDIARRALTLPLEQEAAKADFIKMVRHGAGPEEVEAGRLLCVTLYEAQLDLVIEAGANQRAIAVETGREPK